MKTLILIRHAHRDTHDRSADNGLSAKGKRQVERLRESLLARDPKAAFLTSPKRRCRETLVPLAEQAGALARVEPLLDEQGPDESEGELHARVQSFAEWFRSEAPALTYACSHGDWLPLCIEELSGEAGDLRKGAWARLVLAAHGGVRLEKLEREP